MLRLSPTYQPCDRHQAGVERIYIIQSYGVSKLGFDSDGRVTTIILNPGYSLKQIDFEREAAILRQNLRMTASYPLVDQEINFTHQGAAQQIVNAIMAMALAGTLIVLAELSDGSVVLLGCNIFSEQGFHYEVVGMKMGSGSMSSGTPTSGGNEMNHSLICSVNSYAPKVLVNLESLPIDRTELPTVPDTTAPTIIEYLPADGSTGVNTSPAISLIFSEAVVPGSGAIELRKYSDDSVVKSWQPGGTDVAIAPLTYEVTLSHSLTLDFLTQYYLHIPAGAFLDGSGNQFAGNSKGDADFTTYASIVVTPPEVSSLSPADDASGVTVPLQNFTATLTLDKPVAEGVGNFLLFLAPASGGALASVSVGSSAVTISGASVSVTFPVNLSGNTEYVIKVDAGAIVDLYGNPFAGILDATTWNFETGADLFPRIENVQWEESDLFVSVDNTPEGDYSGADPEGDSEIQIVSYPTQAGDSGRTVIETLGPGDAFTPTVDLIDLWLQIEYKPIDDQGVEGVTVISGRTKVQANPITLLDKLVTVKTEDTQLAIFFEATTLVQVDWGDGLGPIEYPMPGIPLTLSSQTLPAGEKEITIYGTPENHARFIFISTDNKSVEWHDAFIAGANSLEVNLTIEPGNFYTPDDVLNKLEIIVDKNAGVGFWVIEDNFEVS